MDGRAGPIDAAGGSLIIPPPKGEYQSEDCRLSATPWALLVQGPALMVVRDTFLAELKTLFGLVVAGFEPGFSDPKAHALPLRQSYAVPQIAYLVLLLSIKTQT